MTINFTAKYCGQQWDCQIFIRACSKNYVYAEVSARGTCTAVCLVEYGFGRYCACFPDKDMGCNLGEGIEYNLTLLENVEAYLLERVTMAHAIDLLQKRFFS